MTFVQTYSNQPKRILALDGGGIRGLIAAEVLIKIEAILKELNPNLTCLADYFDFIGGTSTGAILAAGLVKGMSASALRDLYYDQGSKIFQKQNLLCRLWSKYSPKYLEQLLQEHFPEVITLGSPELKKALLMIVTKNATQGNTWFFVNNEKNKFFKTNASIPIWEIIRASSAAPTYFPPFQFQVGDRSYEFIDGGMSSFNNPSFQLFIEATQPEYGVGWQTGIDQLLMISIGTGFAAQTIPFGQAKDNTLLNWAPYAVSALMDDANLQQNLLMKLIGIEPDQAREALQESAPVAPDLPDEALPALYVLETLREKAPKLLTYRRYTTAFNKRRLQQLQQVSGLDPADAQIIAQTDPKDLQQLDCVEYRDALSAIGKAIALEQVHHEIFEKFMPASSGLA